MIGINSISILEFQIFLQKFLAQLGVLLHMTVKCLFLEVITGCCNPDLRNEGFFEVFSELMVLLSMSLQKPLTLTMPPYYLIVFRHIIVVVM